MTSGSKPVDVAVIGSGPYGLAASAHLRAAGVETKTFGEPMDFWEKQMPRGMFLRSAWYASDISAPGPGHTLSEFRARQKLEFSPPVPLDAFIRYGRWFQEELVSDLDRRRVARIDKNGSFRVRLNDGETISARRVVVAAGISRFAFRPTEFAELPGALASHTSEHNDLGRFRGQRVLVVGGGQSAFESAALLKENGAEVELVMRRPEVRWLHGSVQFRSQLGMLRALLYPPTDVGPPGLNQLIARPHLFRLLPRRLQAKWAYRAIRPAASTWLRRRLEGTRITTGCTVKRAFRRGDIAHVELSDGSQREVEHVLLGTGYRVNVSGYEFLAPELLKALQVEEGYPRLDLGLESSIKGLHFLGAPAARSLGPLVRFVSGTGYSARALTRAVVGAAPNGKVLQ
jgi:hypothetical protein